MKSEQIALKAPLQLLLSHVQPSHIWLTQTPHCRVVLLLLIDRVIRLQHRSFLVFLLVLTMPVRLLLLVEISSVFGLLDKEYLALCFRTDLLQVL